MTRHITDLSPRHMNSARAKAFLRIDRQRNRPLTAPVAIRRADRAVLDGRLRAYLRMARRLPATV